MVFCKLFGRLGKIYVTVSVAPVSVVPKIVLGATETAPVSVAPFDYDPPVSVAPATIPNTKSVFQLIFCYPVSVVPPRMYDFSDAWSNRN